MFKECTGCKKFWKSRDMFLSDPKISFLGYQATFDNLGMGYFLFNHLEKKCLTTMSIPADEFLDLCAKGSTPDSLGEKCHENCTYCGTFKACTRQNKYGCLKEIIQNIKKLKKT
jgi:hypothetical protein